MTQLRTLLLSATLFSSCAGLAQAASLEFSSVPVPTEDAAKRQVNTSTSVTIDGKPVALSWNVLARSGQKFGDVAFGTLVTAAGGPVLSKDGKPDVSNNPDFTSILKVGSKLFSVTHFENVPGAMYLSELAQDKDGKLSILATRPIDFSAVGGIWDPCAGSVTPWQTHLGSEEYPPDARGLESAAGYTELDSEMLDMGHYFGTNANIAPLAAFKAVFNPYKYGYATEVAVSEQGDTKVTKHYSMGRYAIELAKVMPDKKTAYMTDDGVNTGLYRFVADKEGDLSSGTLYAAKWNQTSADNGGAATINWIDLGHASDAEIAPAIQFGAKFSDLFETAKFKDDGSCPEGFLSSNAEGRSECLKVKPGMETYASRLESRRYASMKGATTEFRKMEGLAFDPDGKRLFMAMTDISSGMEDNIKDGKFDKGGRNDIKLAKNPCGAVYAMTLDSGYVVTDAKGFVVGKPNEYKDGPYQGQTCDVDGIANPDNLTFIPGSDTLLIGEDTGTGHQNDASWAVHGKTGALTRITTTPYGAENTSLDWYDDINGFGYLMTVVQHPYGESDKDKLQKPEDKQGLVGYIGPFPVIK